MKVLRSCESDPAGCVRHRLDEAASDSATDEWNADSEPAAPVAKSAPAKPGPSDDQIRADEESYVLNQVNILDERETSSSNHVLFILHEVVA